MMIYLAITLLCVLMFVLGYGVAVYILARDPDLLRLQADEAIVKKPKDGLILVACTPDVARRMITNPEGFEQNEARAMYQRSAEKK